MKILNNFDLFINWKSCEVLDFYYISFDCLEYCSYVDYIYVPVINGEINDKPYYIEYNDLDKIKYDEVVIYAINHCDKICLEVKI